MENPMTVEKQVNQLIINRFHLIVAVLGLLIPVMTAFGSIETDIALIKQNHLTHLENMEKEIVDIKKREDIRDANINDLLKTFSETNATMNREIGKLSK